MVEAQGRPVMHRRCDQCRHIDLMPGVHPQRCRSPVLAHSMSTGLMREAEGICGMSAILWEPKEAHHQWPPPSET